ncbi:hypothetical protein ACHAWF_006241 [Thalassiosira exigua]
MFMESFENSDRNVRRREAREEAMRRMREAAAVAPVAEEGGGEEAEASGEEGGAAVDFGATSALDLSVDNAGWIAGAGPIDYDAAVLAANGAAASASADGVAAEYGERNDDDETVGARSTAHSVTSASNFLRDTRLQYELESRRNSPRQSQNKAKARPWKPVRNLLPGSSSSAADSGEGQRSWAPPPLHDNARRFLWDDNSVASGFTRGSAGGVNLHDIKDSFSYDPRGLRSERSDRGESGGGDGDSDDVPRKSGGLGGLWSALPLFGKRRSAKHPTSDDEGEGLVERMEDCIQEDDDDDDSFAASRRDSYGDSRRPVYLDGEGNLSYDRRRFGPGRHGGGGSIGSNGDGRYDRRESNQSNSSDGEFHSRRMRNSIRRSLKPCAIVACAAGVGAAAIAGAVAAYPKILKSMNSGSGRFRGDVERYGDWSDWNATADDGSAGWAEWAAEHHLGADGGGEENGSYVSRPAKPIGNPLVHNKGDGISNGNNGNDNNGNDNNGNDNNNNNKVPDEAVNVAQVMGEAELAEAEPAEAELAEAELDEAELDGGNEEWTNAKPTEPPFYQTRFDHIRDVLAHHPDGVTLPPTLFDEEAPQHAAALWLARDDPRQIDPTDPLLVQRFGLAVLWFSTTRSGYDWRTASHPGRRAATQNDPGAWFRHAGWLGESSVCSWYGVKCHPFDGEVHDQDSEKDFEGDVTHLELRRNNLRGLIPHEIYGTLPKLRVLDLSDNGLAGTLLGRFGSWGGSLESLNLTSNVVAGSIPPGLGELTRLKELSLANNLLEGSIPHSVGSLGGLKSLDLSGNSLRGTVPYELGRLGVLGTLDLSYNFLVGPVPHEVSEMRDLVTLDLSHNQLGGLLPGELGLVTYLSALRLNDNHFSGEMPAEIGGLVHLEELRLDGNDFRGALPTSISKLDALGELPLDAFLSHAC